MSYLKFKDLGGGNKSSSVNSHPLVDNSVSEGVPEPRGGGVSQEVVSPKIVRVKSIAHKKNIISTHDIVVNDVYGKWCGPCKHAKPEFKKIASRYANSNVFFIKENVDDNFSNDITGVPAFQFFVKGVQDGIITGADMKSVENKIRGYFN